jgi:dephospho-CoA kinase
MGNPSNGVKEEPVPILKVAVTGCAASGKTSVCQRLAELGARVISADVLARQAVEPGSAAFKNIIDHFGQGVLTPEGVLDRKMLRRIVFENDKARKTLEQFVHPEVIRLMRTEMNKAEKEGEWIIVVEVPLLFESGLEDLFDVTVNVSVPHELQIQRLMERDKVPINEARALLKTQMPDHEKSKYASAVLKNTGSIEQMKKSVDIFYDNFSKLYKKRRKRLTVNPL